MTKHLSAAPEPNNRGLVWLVAGAFFMELLDATVITTALPQMAASFHTDPIHMSTGVSAYMLALAVFIPLSGWVADRFGPRHVFGSAILLFTFASLLCSLSTNLWFFTAARLLQGFAGAMMVPVGRLLVLRSTPKEKLVHAIATLTWPGLAAPVLGPALGGFITEHWGWHWIFLLNIPFGLAGFVLTLWLIHGSAGGPRPFDSKGFLLSGIGCSALMLACDLASHTPFNAWQVGGAGAVGLVATGWAVRHLRQCAHPLLSLTTLSIPSFAIAMRGGTLMRMAINSAPFLMPMMFQLCFGLNATDSGLLLLALFAGNICMKPATTPLIRAFGFRRILLGNGVLVAAGFALCMFIEASTPRWLTMSLLFFTGLTRSMQFTALNTFSFCDVPTTQMNDASTLSSILLQMSAGLGITVAAIALRLASLFLPSEAHTLTPAAFQLALGAMAVLSLVSLIDVYPLAPNAGANVSGHRNARANDA